MSIGARCAARPGLALLGCIMRRIIELGLFEHKERARVSALRLLWALIEQRKRKNLLCTSGGSVAAFGLVLARCARCSVVLGAV